MSCNDKNATNLLGNLNVGKNANVNLDLTVQQNINLGEQLQSTTPLCDDTTFISGNFNVGDLLTVDNTTGLVQVANDLIVYGKLIVPEIDYSGIVQVGDQIILNGTDGSITTLTLNASTGTFGTVIAEHYIGLPEFTGGYIGDLIVDNLQVLNALTGANAFFTNLTSEISVTNVLTVNTGAYIYELTGTSARILVFEASTGVFDTLYVKNQAVFDGPVILNDNLYATGSTGVFGTIKADHYIGLPEPQLTGHYDSLSVDNLTFQTATGVDLNVEQIITQTISAGTGVFTTIQADQYIGLPQPELTGHYDSLSVDNLVFQTATGVDLYVQQITTQDAYVEGDLYIGDEVKPLDGDCKDTLFIQGSLNVNDMVTINGETGKMVVANELEVLGALTVHDIQFGGYTSIEGQLNVQKEATFEDTVIIQGDLYGQTGVFGTIKADHYIGLPQPELTGHYDSLSVDNLVFQTATGVDLNIEQIITQTIFAATGVFTTIQADQYIGLPQPELTGHYDSLSVDNLVFQTATGIDLYTEQIITQTIFAQTGIFTTIQADQYIGLPQPEFTGHYDSLSVDNLVFQTSTGVDLYTEQIITHTILAQTGVFTTIQADQYIGLPQPELTGHYDSLSVDNLVFQTATGVDLYTEQITTETLTTQDAYVEGDLYLGDEVKPLDGDCKDTLLIQGSLNVGDVMTVNGETGEVVIANELKVLGALTVQDIQFAGYTKIEGSLTVDGETTFGSTATFQGDLIAQTGIFGTIKADHYIGLPQPELTGHYDSLSIDNLVFQTATGVDLYTQQINSEQITTQDLYLGDEVKPLDGDCKDTLQVEGNLNVAQMFSVDAVEGTVEVANNLVVHGSITCNEYYFPGLVNFGSQLVLDGANNTITTGDLKISSAYFATTGAAQYQAIDASRGQIYIPDGDTSAVVFTTKVSEWSYVNCIICNPDTAQIVSKIVPYNGYFIVYVSGSSGNRKVNWLIVN